MASGKFSTLQINLAIGFTQKNQLECIGKAVMMLYIYTIQMTIRCYIQLLFYNSGTTKCLLFIACLLYLL